MPRWRAVRRVPTTPAPGCPSGRIADAGTGCLARRRGLPARVGAAPHATNRRTSFPVRPGRHPPRPAGGACSPARPSCCTAGTWAPCWAVACCCSPTPDAVAASPPGRPGGHRTGPGHRRLPPGLRLRSRLAVVPQCSAQPAGGRPRHGRLRAAPSPGCPRPDPLTWSGASRPSRSPSTACTRSPAQRGRPRPPPGERHHPRSRRPRPASAVPPTAAHSRRSTAAGRP